MDLPQRIACHGVARAAKGVAIFSALVLFYVGGLKSGLVATPDPYTFYGVSRGGLASLTAMVEVII